MSVVAVYAKERRFLDRIADELRACRQIADHAGICESVEDLEMIVQHTVHAQLRKRAQKLIDSAFDPFRG